jgi:cytidylate kinase
MLKYKLLYYWNFRRLTVKGHINIAIDGPSGSGKSTLAKNLAKRFGLVYIDTGSLYRTVGLYVKEQGVLPSDREGITDCLKTIDIKMTLENGGNVVYLNGRRIGDEIRTPEASYYASEVSKIPEVRQFLLDIQKETAKNNDCVMDGRDIGTVIMPNADVKIFLCASGEDRALRRYNELVSRGEKVTYEDILKDMAWRDNNDKDRDIAPAVPAPDAVILNNSGFEESQTLEKAVQIIEETLKSKSRQDTGKEGL